MKISDNFLATKVDTALTVYFGYLTPAFDLTRSEKISRDSCGEDCLLAKFSHDNVEFQVRTSTLVLEVFHSIELVLKALLAQRGEYLLFESLDDYLKGADRVRNTALARDKTLAKVRKQFADRTLAGKVPPESVAKAYMESITRVPVDNFGKSVSAPAALKRVLFFEPDLGNLLSEEVFDRLTSLRNQIVHFGELANLLQGVVDALRCLISLCKWASRTFPSLGVIPGKFADQLDLHNQMMPHLMLHEAMPRITNDVLLLFKEGSDAPTVEQGG